MKFTCGVCFWLVISAIALSPLLYEAIVSWPDSTDYFLQDVDSSVEGPDGRDYIYVGDDLHIVAYNYRHLINGTCLLDVSRYRENVGGKYDGKKTLIQFVQQQFVGDGILRKTSWPIPPEKIKVDESWFDDVAQGHILFTVNPADGQRITLNGTNVTFVIADAADNQVKIGESVSMTLRSLITLLQTSDDQQIAKNTYAISGTNLDITSKTAGTTMNSYTLTSNVRGSTVSGATMIGGDEPSVTEQEMDIYTAGTYDCNLLDHIRKALGFPRIMHDGKLNPFREKTRVVLVRREAVR